MIRRLAAAIMAVAMLHLSVTAADAACADHDAMVTRHAGASPARALQHAPVHDSHVGAGLAEQTPAPPCDAPAPPSCCSVIAGCATIGLTSHVTPAAPALPDAAPAHERPAKVLTSRRAAPEPPPPKR
ncbi:MAG TPA: hypothetical protein VFI52_15315 [Gemmatimonadaceae bacterium]|nr:hypothetical protein [Gemmatimonadaceae bacterium]